MLEDLMKGEKKSQFKVTYTVLDTQLGQLNTKAFYLATLAVFTKLMKDLLHYQSVSTH